LSDFAGESNKSANLNLEHKS